MKLLVLAVAFAPFLSLADAAGNAAAANPGFEDGFKGWTTVYFWKGAEGDAAVDDKVSHSGKKSVRLSKAIRSFGAMSPPVKIVPGKDCEVSFWAKVSNFNTDCFPWVSVNFQDSSGKNVGYIPFSYADFAGLPPDPIRSEEWTRYSYLIKSTDKRLSQAETMKIALSLGHPYFSKTKKAGATVVWYDDLSVRFQSAPLHLESTGVEYNALFFKEGEKIPPIVFKVKIANPEDKASSLKFSCVVKSFSGRTAFEKTESLSLKPGEELDKQVPVQAEERGYYSVSFSLKSGDATLAERSTDFAVMEDLSDGNYDDASPFGFHCQSLETDAPILEKIGVKWIRGPLGWAQVEGEKGSFDWSEPDKVMKLCEKHHFRYLPVIRNVPKWASSATEKQLSKKGENMPTHRDNPCIYPPKSYEDYANFVFEFFKRYKDSVRYAEFWNEPDFMYLSDPVNEWCGSEEDFAKLMKYGYEAAKKANPSAKLLFSGLTTHRGKDKFIEGVMKAGGWKYFDIVSLHGYDKISRFLDRWELINSFCKEKKPAWDTEFGIGSKSREDDFQKAGDYVRQNTENLAHGIEKSFYFTFAHGQHVFAMIRGYDDNVAKPLFATIPYYVKTMKGAKFVSEAKFADKRSNGFLFQKDGNLFGIVWGSSSVGMKRLVVGVPELRVANIMGEESALKTEDGAVSMNLTDFPVYLKGIAKLEEGALELPSEANLVENDSFETFYGDSATGLKAKGWETLDKFDPEGTFELSREYKRSGVRSYLVRPSAKNKDYAGIECQIGRAAKGKYLIQAFIRTEGLEKPLKYGLVWNGGEKLFEAKSLDSKDFLQYEGSVDLDSDKENLRLQLRVYGKKGGAWFDKVKLFRLGDGAGKTAEGKSGD